MLTWSEKKCVFCGKKSARRAILVNALRCCESCDRREWPGKITKTQALKDYPLKETDLFVYRSNGRRHPAPGLQYGIYFCQGGHATMILEESLGQILVQVHGEDWKIDKERREALRASKGQKKIVGRLGESVDETQEAQLSARPD
jgi:hypothetical protein